MLRRFFTRCAARPSVVASAVLAVASLVALSVLAGGRLTSAAGPQDHRSDDRRPASPVPDVLSPVLQPPRGLEAEATGPSTVRLIWQEATVTGRGVVAGYRVFQDGTSTAVVSVGPEVLTAEVGSLEPGISYGFTVRAIDADGRYSAPSEEVELTMPARPTVSDGPQGTPSHAD
ncbi:fibronectin type III domain-containing protein [Streptomyces sp. OF3]|uniref:Fibronectin type III domain-containing protein n=1 Tax=Streptomyces alkaliterrae TaxID=2213162 RepID=A0A7W3WLI1_9ACTN|nr:fibronectin type III domain-containing protein [Streptomyces alkaliterrae]MBB1254556.1 fibronectin type III domain-containing protein [Streptomyces alkaliterrae]